MDRILSQTLANITIVLLIRGLVALPQKEKPNTVKLPRWFLIAGLVGCCLFLILAVFSIRSGDYGTSVIFLLFALMGGSLILAACNTRVTYDEDGFTARSFLGLSRRYSYGDITCVLGKTRDVKICVGNRVVRLDAWAVGKDTFLAYAKKRYRALHSDRLFPTRPQPGNRNRDLFRGNISDPGEFVFLYIFTTVLYLLLCGYMPFSEYPNPEKWERAAVVFTSRQTAEDGYILREDAYSGYYQLDLPLSGEDALLDAIDRGETFDVRYKSLSRESPHRWILSLSDETGRCYLSVEDGFQKEYGNWRIFAMIMLGFVLLWIVMISVGILAGRYPERFGPRIVYGIYPKHRVLYDFDRKKQIDLPDP